MKEKLVVVLDTNVFVSGLLCPSGVPGIILRRFRQGDFEIATSPDQIKEIRTVLKRPSLSRALPKGTTQDVLRFFVKFKKLTKIHKPIRRHWNFQDTGDHFLLDLIIHVGANYLVTGDKALIVLKLVQNCAIVLPAEFVTCL